MKLLSAERRKQLKSIAAAELTPQPTTGGSAETGLWVRQALDRLDAVEREILMLRQYEQLSYSEIANLLRIPVNTVRSRLFRSRLAMRSYLESGARPNPGLRTIKATPAQRDEARNEHL